MLQPDEIAHIEVLLVEFRDIFARLRFDIGMNEEFTVQLTPKDNSPAYSQSLPTPINLSRGTGTSATIRANNNSLIFYIR